MTEVLSVQVKQTGFPGAPGWSTLCFSPIVVLPNADKIQAAYDFWLLAAQSFPLEWTGIVVGPCQIQDVATGELLGVEVPPPGTTDVFHGGGGLGYGAGVAGACISWYTASNGNGRPPRGRTFLVPLGAGSWQNNGTLVDAARADIEAHGQALVDSGTGFGVWRRPVNRLGGEFFTAIQARVTDQAAFLSSRRV